MKSIGRWLAKSLGTALSIVLVFVTLPYASQLAAHLMPDLSGAALTESATLAREMRASARLETSRVEESGVLTSTTSAFLLGVVQSVAIPYRYEASIGIDLNQVQLEVQGNEIIFRLPAPQVLHDSLTPDFTQAVIQDTWYALTDVRRQELLEKEQQERRAAALADAGSADMAWAHAAAVFESYIAQWISAGNSRLTYRCEPLPVPEA